MNDATAMRQWGRPSGSSGKFHVVDSIDEDPVQRCTGVVVEDVDTNWEFAEEELDQEQQCGNCLKRPDPVQEEPPAEKPPADVEPGAPKVPKVGQEVSYVFLVNGPRTMYSPATILEVDAKGLAKLKVHEYGGYPERVEENIPMQTAEGEPALPRWCF